MGYYTRFGLEVDSEKSIDIIGHFRSIDDSASYALNSDGSCRDQTKWYGHGDSLISISKMYPDVLFTLSGEGEESGDLWKKYAMNGLVQKEEAVITYGPFDKSKLK